MRIAELSTIGAMVYRDAPRPVAGAGEVVIRTRAVGLCGTDLKAYLRGHPYFKPPCVLGHEFTGVVAEVGPEVTNVAVGDRVVAAPYVECGVCGLCRAGVGELCRDKAFVAGALQEFILLPAAIVRRATFVLPADVGFAVGSLAEPLACVINGIERSNVGPDDRVLVIGGGPMGALLAIVAQSKTPRVIVSEIAPARLDALRTLGMDAVDPSSQDLAHHLASSFGAPVADRVLIAVGATPVAEQAMQWAAPGGTVLLFGGLPKDASLAVDPFAIHYQEVSLVGSFGFRSDHFRTAVQWLSDHSERAASLIADTVPFEDVEAGFRRAEQASGLKTVIMFGGPDEP